MEIIHIVLGKANPERMNGVNKVVFQLATKQTEFGEKVSVYGITKDCTKNYEDRKFETLLFKKSINPFWISKALKKEILSKKGTAVFHIHGGWIPAFFTIALFLKRHQIPFVFTPHGAYNTIAMKKNFYIKRIYFSLFEKEILNNTAKIHCIGKSEIKGLLDIYSTHKTILLPYGFENNAKIKLKITSQTKIIFGFVGRLDIYTKGLDTLITAFSNFIKKHPNAELWIIGDSKERDLLEKMIRKSNLNDTVKLLGSKFGAEKEAFLNKIDIFVHPSRNEGLPSSVLEAASFGKPCIVTHATNIGDLILQYNAGISIHSQSSVRLKFAMINLYETWLNQWAFIKMQRKAVQMVNENYNWEKVIKDFNANLYELQ